jgi:hypothetical protein
MLRQYGPQHFTMQTLAGRLIPIGTVPVGRIVRIGISPHTMRTRPVLVLAWLPREHTATRRVPVRGGYPGQCTYENTFFARGGHLAMCRDLSTGKIIRVSDAFLHDEE